MTGLSIIDVTSDRPAGVMVEWTALGAAEPRAASGFAPTFAYNAVRIPLYLAWSGKADANDMAPFLALWAKRSMTGLSIIDVTSDRPAGVMGEKGYAAIADLAACAASGTRLPPSFSNRRPDEVSLMLARLTLFRLSCAIVLTAIPVDLSRAAEVNA
eukprot:gene48258-65474_t